jgi:hypothetical protein
MTEFLEILFNGANVVATALLLFTVVYWLIAIFGIISSDLIEIDLDLEAESDVDFNATGADGAFEVSWINNALQFLNLGKIPFMVWLSFLALPLWIISVNLNSLLGFESFLSGLIVFFPTAFVCLFIAKFLTWPFVKIFAKLDEGNKSKEIIGKTGLVISSASATSLGMAEVNYNNNSFLRFNIRCTEGTSVQKGETVLFIRRLNDRGVYLIEPYNSID